MSKLNKRINFVLIISLIAIVLVVINVFIVTIYQLHFRSNTSLKPYIQSVSMVNEKIFANRGFIYDRNNQVIAQDQRTYDIICYLDKNRISNKNQVAYVDDPIYTSQVLSNILKMDKDEIYYYLTQEGLYQTELGIKGRNLQEEVKDEILNYPNIHGIAFKESTKRIYPYNGDFAPYLIGFAQNDDNGKLNGKMGLELYLNNELSGTDGSHIYQVDKRGYILPGMYEEIIEQKNGYDVYLTLDASIQQALENSFNELKINNNASKAWAAVVEIESGKILAWGQSPSFNPNVLDIDDYLNYGSQYAYEPGSVMKSFIYATAMDIGIYDGNKLFDSSPFCYYGSEPYRVYNDKNYGCIYNAGNKSWGNIELDYGLILSSNVATSTLLTDYVKSDIFEKYLNDFGFFEYVDSDGIAEVKGIKNYRYPSEKLAMTYGQGSSVTMLQLLQAYTAIFGNGEMIKPYFIDKIVDNANDSKIIYQGQRKVINKVIKEDTAYKMQALLERVVKDPKGTAKFYAIDEVDIIAKTGTSEIAISGGYESDEAITSVMLAFPSQKPKYMLYYAYISPYDYYNHTNSKVIKDFIKKLALLTDVGFKTKDGSLNNEIKTYIFDDYYNQNVKDIEKSLTDRGLEVYVFGDGEIIVDQAPKLKEVYTGQKVFLKTISDSYSYPDFSGWSRKEIEQFADLFDIEISFSGQGLAFKQSIEPQNIISPDDKLSIELKQIEN